MANGNNQSNGINGNGALVRWISVLITVGTLIATAAIAIGSKPSRDYVDEQDRRVATEARYERERMEARVERQYGEILKRLDALAAEGH